MAQHTEAKVRLHEFAEHDSSLRELVARARSAIGLFVVGTGRRAALENLIRKCTGYATTSVQELHQPDDNARVEITTSRVNHKVCDETPSLLPHARSMMLATHPPLRSLRRLRLGVRS